MSRCRSTDWSRTARSAWPSRPPTPRASNAPRRSISSIFRPSPAPPDKPVVQPPPPCLPRRGCTSWPSAATASAPACRPWRMPVATPRISPTGSPDHLTSADGVHATPEPPEVLAGLKASARSITEACDHLHALVQKKQVHEHDIVAVVIASHVLGTSDGVVIAAADTAAIDPPRPSLGGLGPRRGPGPVDRLRLPRRRVPRWRPRAEGASQERDQAVCARLAEEAGRDHVHRLEGRAERRRSNQAARLLRAGGHAGAPEGRSGRNPQGSDRGLYPRPVQDGLQE